MIDIQVLSQLQKEARDRALAEIEDLLAKLRLARLRLENNDNVKSLRFTADAGNLDKAIAEHATLTKLIGMEQSHE